MNDVKPTIIPKERRIQHSSGITTCPTSPGTKHSAGGYGFYCWQAFGGRVFYVTCPPAGVTAKPTITMYVNGEVHKSFSPSEISPALPGKYFYEVIFTGLSYGDEFYVTTNYGDGNRVTNTRTYIGERGSAPVLSESTQNINAELSSPYDRTYSMALGVISFDRDYGALNSYSREARTRLLESCLQYTEQDAVLGKVGNAVSTRLDQYDATTDAWIRPSAFTREAQIYRFGYDKLSTYSPVRVGIASSSSADYYSYFSNYVNAWIADVNELLGGIYFVRDDSVTEDATGIRITLGSHSDLWGYNPDEATEETYIHYGTWEITSWYTTTGGTAHCEVKLCNELRGAMAAESDFRNITYEELTECLGCGNDTFRVYDSMFSEIWYVGKSNNLLSGNTPTYDGEVVQMLYNELEMGDTLSQLVHKLTPSQACVIKLPSVKYGNVRNQGYSLQTYAMNRKVTWRTENGILYWYWTDSDNSFSAIESSISITPGYTTPAKAPTVKERGSDYLYLDVGNTNTYDVMAVDNRDNEYITNDTDGRYIYVRGLSPTTSYSLYSRISGTTSWYGGNTATTNPAPPRLSVSASGTTLSITVNPPTQGTYSHFYISAYYTYNGESVSEYVDDVIAGTEYTFNADAGTRYTVYAYTVYTVSGTKLYSTTVYETGTMGKSKATNPTATRINGGIIVNWNTVSNATRYRIRATNTETNEFKTVTTTAPPCTINGLAYGVKYNIAVDTYDGGWLGYCTDEPITTAPAQPVISSVTQNSGVITVSWSLAAASNISRVYMNLYTVGGVLLQKNMFENVTSGTFSFSAVDDGYYQIRAASSLFAGTTEIFSVDYNGNDFTLYQSVHVSARPSPFYWRDYTAYMQEGGVITYTPHEAWNALISNIKEMIAFTGNNGNISHDSALYGPAVGKTYTQACDYALIDSTDKTVYAYKFNIANHIISNLGEGTGVVSKTSRNSKVYASDFISLQDTINNIN